MSLALYFAFFEICAQSSQLRRLERLDDWNVSQKSGNVPIIQSSKSSSRSNRPVVPIVQSFQSLERPNRPMSHQFIRAGRSFTALHIFSKSIS